MVWINAVASSVLALAATAASAHLTVVADRGGKSAQPYYVAISGAHVAEKNGYHARTQAHFQGPVGEAATLPVRSSPLSPGRVAARTLYMPPTMTPFFLIGSGPMSQRWLKQRRARLLQLHAVGLVVNVKTESRMRALRRLGHGLVLRPVAGNDIARRLRVSHYPVLVTPTAIQQ